MPMESEEWRAWAQERPPLSKRAEVPEHDCLILVVVASQDPTLWQTYGQFVLCEYGGSLQQQTVRIS